MISEAGTPHCLAAASTSIARAVAPARRISSHVSAIEVLPPVICTPLASRLPYRLSTNGA